MLASYAALKEAAEYVRAGHGPAFVHGHVIRPYSHSLSDDEKLYRSEEERKAEMQRDPIPRFQMFLLREGILDEEGITRLEKEIDREVQEAADRALAAPAPTVNTVMNYVYSDVIDPTSPAFATQPKFRQARAWQAGRRKNNGRPDQRLPAR